MGEDELSALMKQYVAINEKIKQLKEQKANTKANILICLKTKDLECYEDEENKASFKPITRRVINKEKVQEFLGSKYEEVLDESTSEVLRVVKLGREE